MDCLEPLELLFCWTKEEERSTLCFFDSDIGWDFGDGELGADKCISIEIERNCEL